MVELIESRSVTMSTSKFDFQSKKLISLPFLSENVRILNCSRNDLTSLPLLPTPPFRRRSPKTSCLAAGSSAGPRFRCSSFTAKASVFQTASAGWSTFPTGCALETSNREATFSRPGNSCLPRLAVFRSSIKTTNKPLPTCIRSSPRPTSATTTTSPTKRAWFAHAWKKQLVCTSPTELVFFKTPTQ